MTSVAPKLFGEYSPGALTRRVLYLGHTIDSKRILVKREVFCLLTKIR